MLCTKLSTIFIFSLPYKMSVNVAVFVRKIRHRNAKGKEKMEHETIKEQMKNLLSQALPLDDRTSLRNEGFRFKRPTRASGILAALYKKAAQGDMSAIKEVLSLISDKEQPSNSEVTIIDDVPR